MSALECKLLRCDRCGTSVELKLIEVTSQDGGFTKAVKYESMPEGWVVVDIGEIPRHREYIDLCPACHEYICGEYGRFLYKVGLEHLAKFE